MLSTILFLSFFLDFAPISSAQDAPSAADSLPTCANSCVQAQTSGNEIGGCSSLDIGCICGNSSFLDDIACCLAENCSEADQEQGVQYAKQICGSAGVDVPDQVVCRTIDSLTSSTTSRAVRSSTSSQESETTEESESRTIDTVDVTTFTTEVSTTSSVKSEESSSSTGVSAGGETSASAPPNESSDTSSDESNDSGGLSLGAKIGLGVGLPIAAVILGLLLWLFCLRSRRQANPGSQNHGTVTPASPHTGPYEADGAAFKPELSSVSHQSPHELQNAPMRQTAISRRQVPPVVSHAGHEMSATPIISGAYTDPSSPHPQTDPHLPEMQAPSHPSHGYELAATSISGSTAQARSDVATLRSGPHVPEMQGSAAAEEADDVSGEGVSEREALHRRQLEIMRERERLTRLSRLDEEEREIQARLQRLAEQ